MKHNGAPNDKSATSAGQNERAKKTVQDFVLLIQRRVAEIIKSVSDLESEAGFTVQDAIVCVNDEDILGDLNTLGLRCEDALREIEETADQVLRLVDKLGRKAEAAEAVAARAERFIRKRRNTVRDEKIAQLRDDHRLSFGQIGKQLGIGREAARKAYNRHKATTSNADRSKRPQADKSNCPR